MEYNLKEVVKNNIFGIKNVVEVVKVVKVKNFVMVLIDKVNNLLNVMGLIKWIVEMIVIGLNEEGCMKFLVVRFGNVFGFCGSVILVFRE